MSAPRPTVARLALSAAFVAAACAPAFGATPASAPAATAAPVAPAAPIDPEKQKLIDRILVAWHPENIAVIMVQRPASDAFEKSRIALQQAQLPKETFEKDLKDIATDIQKYVDTATPIAAASGKKLVGPTAGPLLAQNFTVEELKQIVAMLESPVRSKFEKVAPQIERAVGEKVHDDVGPQINKHIDTLTQSVGTKLRVDLTAK